MHVCVFLFLTNTLVTPFCPKILWVDSSVSHSHCLPLLFPPDIVVVLHLFYLLLMYAVLYFLIYHFHIILLPFIISINLVLSEIFLGCYFFGCCHLNNFFVSNGGLGVCVGNYTKGNFQNCVVTWYENKKLKWIKFLLYIKTNLWTSTLTKVCIPYWTHESIGAE